jgi:2'-5' RNA ligase
MLRLFVGLAVPEDIAADLAALGGALPGARWIEPENMHLTLRFIGEVAEHDAEEIGHELARVAGRPFSYDIAGVDTFGQGRKAHSLHALVPLTPELQVLQGRVEAAVTRAGQPRETRRFTPHVTLARLKAPPADRLQAFIEGHSLLRAGPVAVDQFILYESRMGKSGSAYFPLAEYPLG